MNKSKLIEEKIRPVVESLGYELWAIMLIGRASSPTLRVYIDSQSGINIEDCERVSHQLSAFLDVEDPLPGNYTLEVSSPGLDRPLFTLEHYQRFIGHTVAIRFYHAIDGHKNLKALIEDVRNEEVILKVEDQELTLQLSAIAKANLVF